MAVMINGGYGRGPGGQENAQMPLLVDRPAWRSAPSELLHKTYSLPPLTTPFLAETKGWANWGGEVFPHLGSTLPLQEGGVHHQ